METLNVKLFFFFSLTEKVKLNVGELFCVGASVEPGAPASLCPHLHLSVSLQGWGRKAGTTNPEAGAVTDPQRGSGHPDFWGRVGCHSGAGAMSEGQREAEGRGWMAHWVGGGRGRWQLWA